MISKLVRNRVVLFMPQVFIMHTVALYMRLLIRQTLTLILAASPSEGVAPLVAAAQKSWGGLLKSYMDNLSHALVLVTEKSIIEEGSLVSCDSKHP